MSTWTKLAQVVILSPAAEGQFGVWAAANLVQALSDALNIPIANIVIKATP